jgi:chromate transporter
MSATDLLQLFAHFLALSLLAVGGAITVAPDMHRYVVDQQGWITDAQFTASIALAQASPGPNILFVTLIGWNAAGWAGALAATVGILLPASVLALVAFRGMERLRDHRAVRAFRAGMAPITIGLLLATGWILAANARGEPLLLVVAGVTAVVAAATRLNPLWLLGAGAVVGIVASK